MLRAEVRNKPAILALVTATLALSTAGCDSNGNGKLDWGDLLGGSHQARPTPTANPADAKPKESTPHRSSADGGSSPPVATTPAAPAPVAPAPGASTPGASAPTPPVATARETTHPFDFPRDAQGDATSATCSFDHFVPVSNTKVFAAGAYAGRALGYQIDQSGHQATQIDVAVNYQGVPVVLMLGAYEPTVWNIGWSRGTQIAAVLVSGYQRQVIAGLPSSVPTLVSTYDNKGACGYFYVSTDNLDGLNPMARRVFGRSVDMVFPAKDGRVVIGNALAPGVSLVTGPKTPNAYRDPNTPLAGPAGLADDVQKGLLREATAADAQAWANALAAQPSNADLPPVAGVGRPIPRAPGLYNAYVVLKPMVVPAGLYGANAATFFVPKGTPRPTGNLGHSKIYDFNTMTCAGLTCRMGQ